MERRCAVLEMERGRRFYKLFNALMAYVNAALDVRPSLSQAHPSEWSDEDRFEVIDELWHNRQVIDDFVDENPLGFDTADLETVLKWRQGINGLFYVRVDEGRVKFLRDRYIFEVSDLALPIAEMLDRTPTFVYTTLLPFDGLIVYDTLMQEIPLAENAQVDSAMAELFSDALREGFVVKGALEFEEAALRIMEECLERELSELHEDLDYEEHPEKKRDPGMHRGRLAGLSEEERRDALDEALRDTRDAMMDFSRRFLESLCVKAGPDAAFATMLQVHKKDDLKSLARVFGLKGFSALNKAGLAALVAQAAPARLDWLDMNLLGIGLHGFRTLRSVYEAGGRLRLDKQALDPDCPLPMPSPLFLYVFDRADFFEFVIPEEVLPFLSTLEWRLHQGYFELIAGLVRVAGLSAALWGIVPIEEVYADAQRLCPCEGLSGFAQEDCLDILIEHHDEEREGFELFEFDGAVYAVASALADGCLDDDDGAFLDDGVYAGFGEESLATLRGLLKAQQHAPSRPLTEEMFQAGTLRDWAMKQPAVLAMRDFIDEHVPDGEDDFFFAENMLDALIEMPCSDCLVQDAVDELEEEGFAFEDKRLLQTELDLLSNLFNSFPRWENKGWTPIELLEQSTGRKVFLDEAGKMRKVGRNDPCPCGSGKKYKKCCGR